ncbi:hypothetical protein GCM10010932_20060 [Agromyces flavus]|nr:hypothetical protein GCM10010932_20060 [Agromyces flavus]
MVAAHGGLEPGLLGLHDGVEERARRKLLVRRVESDEGHGGLLPSRPMLPEARLGGKALRGFAGPGIRVRAA